MVRFLLQRNSYCFKLSLLLMALAAGGCIPQTSSVAFDGVSASYPDASRQLAADAARQLASAYQPGQTEFAVNAKTEFGKSLEDALRRKGFMLSPEGSPVSYSVDMLHDVASPACYVNLNLPDGASISQLYSLKGGMVVPSGDITKTGLPNFTMQPVASPVSTPLTNATETAPAQTIPETLPVLSAMQPVPLTSPVPAPEPIPLSGTVASTAGTELLQAFTELPVSPLFPQTEWHIAPGMLRDQLESWTSQAGYQLVWKARHDFEMESHVIFRDDFIGSVKRLFARMHLHGNPLRAAIYQDNRVLEVVEE